MAGAPLPLLTAEEYLLAERRAETKSEYLDGVVVAMTGASRGHNLIVGNVLGELREQLLHRPCEIYPSDMRVKIPAARVYTYPDVIVACGEPLFEDDEVDTLLTPTVIVEVLSPSTESYDRGQKFAWYRTLSSLSDYLLVAQSAPAVEHLARQPDGSWVLRDYQKLDDIIALPSIQCTLSLSRVYLKVKLPGEVL